MARVSALLAVFCALLAFSVLSASAYDVVVIKNETPFDATGKINLASAFCKDDYFFVKAGGTWTASSRGACLLTGIYCTSFKDPATGKEVPPPARYSSSGTGYSQFAIVDDGKGYEIISRSSSGYPLVTIKNNTALPASGKVKYASALCADDSFTVQPGRTWTARTRGVCLVTEINATVGLPNNVTLPGGVNYAKATAYTTSGTSYSEFAIEHNGMGFEVYREGTQPRFSNGKAPGFYIVNDTDWPVQLGLYILKAPYYWSVIPPKGVMVRDTGAVWFRLQANLSPDGTETIKELDTVKAIGAPIAGIAITGVMTVITGGAALPAMAAAGAAQGVTAGVDEAMRRGNLPQGVIDGVDIFMGAASGGATAAAGAQSLAWKIVAQGAAKSAAITASLQDAGYIAASLGSQKQLQEEFTRIAKSEDSFAGSAGEAMPHYVITGGPRLGVAADGTIDLVAGEPLKLTKYDPAQVRYPSKPKPVQTYERSIGHGSELKVNQFLAVGDYLVSPNKQFFAIMQEDGNFMVYQGLAPDGQTDWRWGSVQAGRYAPSKGNYFAVMQDDGNFVVYRGTHPAERKNILWGSVQDGGYAPSRGNYYAVMQDDGNLVVFHGTGPSDQHGVVWGSVQSRAKHGF